MLFNSVEYLFFLPVSVFLYYLLPEKFSRIFLICTSYAFYMFWKPPFVLIIVGITLFDYWAGILIFRAKTNRIQKFFLGMSLLANLSLLFVFKYFYFFSENINQVSQLVVGKALIPHFDIILPIGLSFHTFQTMSYNIDIYKKRIEPELDLTKFALFVAFFPQMVAGPIERAKHFIPQTYKKVRWNWSSICIGVERITWGLIKKVIVADRLAQYSDVVFDHADQIGGIYTALGVVFFSFQIFCDFSGYSDIAIGSAKILGFNLTENFKTPYLSKNISEFWSRWHITLSHWFRDYVYIPLGGNRDSRIKQSIRLASVFLLSGLWHGAGYTFLLWGFVHACFLIFYNYSKSVLKKFEKLRYWEYFSVGCTFVAVTLAWIPFRAKSVASSALILKRLFEASVISYDFVRTEEHFYAGFFAVLVWFLFGVFRKVWKLPEMSGEDLFALKSNQILRLSAYYGSFLSTFLAIGAFGHRAFIYFQF